MRSYLWCWPGRCLLLFRGRRLRGALFLLTAVAGVGVALAGDSVTVEAQEYSAYQDPEQPALSFVLSEDQNVDDFKVEFGLGDGKIEEVRVAILKENEALAQAYAESEQIIQANEGLPPEEIEEKINASGYHEKVRAAIAETKSRVEVLLPEERRPELGPWVDAKFAQADSGTFEVASGGGRGVTCKVYATQYNGYTRSEVALPHVSPRDKGRSVRISRGNHATKARVKDVGPWNIIDNYWNSRRTYEKMNKWDDLPHLPRCTPWAQAAKHRHYNHGKDQYGRRTNGAGIDLTPQVASRLGLKRYENDWVHVRFPWVRR